MLQQLPLLVQDDDKASELEALNVEFLTKKGLDISVKNMDQIHNHVDNFLEPGTFEKIKTNLAQHNNNAVFDVVRFIEYLHHN